MSNEEELRWMRAFMASDGAAVMRRFGAHSLGIGRLVPGDDREQRSALLFYLDPDGPGTAESVPPELEYVPEDRSEPVALPTRVIESAPAEFE